MYCFDRTTVLFGFVYVVWGILCSYNNVALVHILILLSYKKVPFITTKQNRLARSPCIYPGVDPEILNKGFQIGSSVLFVNLRPNLQRRNNKIFTQNGVSLDPPIINYTMFNHGIWKRLLKENRCERMFTSHFDESFLLPLHIHIPLVYTLRHQNCFFLI